MAARAGRLVLPALVFLLPFEPRRPVLPLLGFQVTLLEAAAAMLGVALLWSARRRLVPLMRRPPLPLAFLALYAAAHVLSAALAPVHRDLAAKFALRMVVMAGLGLASAAAAPEAGRRALVALVAAAVAVAALAIAEGAGVRAVDPFLDHFRETPFNIGGSRRASAGSEYPNLAAAFLMAGLLAAAGLAAAWRRPVRLLLPLAAVLSLGLLLTYSRGAVVAAGLGLGALAAVGRQRRFAPALGALAVLLAASAAFAWTGQVYRLRLAAEGSGAWYGVAYAPAEAALVLRPGEVRSTDVRVTNTGRMTWTADDVFHLAYHWYDTDRRKLEDGRRTLLPRSVAPGETLSLRAELRAPMTEGRYLLAWDMVQERVTWFSDQGLAPGVVPVVVSAAPVAAAGPALPPDTMNAAPLAAPLPWRPGRSELWRLAAALWRQRPLTGMGPDNFRWLYGRVAGQPFWDTRVFANNALIEAAATTGTLGALALAGTLITTALAAASRLHEPGVQGATAAALFAITIGLAAHGAVDYVLAFTGHYLLFGFVAGSAAGLGRSEEPA
jgi:O-antigen ligase